MKNTTSVFSYIKSVTSKKIFNLFLPPVLVTVIIIAYVYISNREVPLYNLSAIAVWQEDEGESSDIAFSIYRSDNKTWLARSPENKESSAVDTIKLEGEDKNPDLATTKTNAIAAWENKTDKDSRIAVSFWSAAAFAAGKSGWTNPETPFSATGQNNQPTVQIRGKDDAIVAWVNQETNLLYSVWNGQNWSEPKPVKETVSTSPIASLQLAEMFNKNANYTLTFTRNGEAFLATFDGQKWLVEKENDIEKLADTPNLDAALDATKRQYHQVKSVVGGAIHEIISLTGQEDAKQTIAGVSSARLSVKDGAVYLIGTDKNHTLTDLLSAQSLADNAKTFDVTALYDAPPLTALSIWSDGKNGLFYSLYDTKQNRWTKSSPLAGAYKKATVGLGVAALQVQVNKKEQTVREEEKPVVIINECGDGVLDTKLGEECEDGIACKSTAEICDWELYKKAGKAIRKNMFPPICACVPLDDTPVPPKKDGDKNKPLTGIWNGAACGFDTFQAKGDLDKDDDITVFLSPQTKAGGTYNFSRTGDRTWSVVSNTGAVPIFPKAKAKNQPEAVILLEFSPDSTAVTMTGVDPTNGFQYCTGTFAKYAPTQGGGLKPAAAPSGGLSPVPSLQEL